MEKEVSSVLDPEDADPVEERVAAFVELQALERVEEVGPTERLADGVPVGRGGRADRS